MTCALSEYGLPDGAACYKSSPELDQTGSFKCALTPEAAAWRSNCLIQCNNGVPIMCASFQGTQLTNCVAAKQQVCLDSICAVV